MKEVNFCLFTGICQFIIALDQEKCRIRHRMHQNGCKSVISGTGSNCRNPQDHVGHTPKKRVTQKPKKVP